MKLAAGATGDLVRRAGPSVGDATDAVVVTIAGSSNALPGTEAGSVKVTPFAEYPGKGRATGGVRCHRFLKGEDALVFAWAGRGARARRRRERCSGRPARGDRPPRRLRHPRQPAGRGLRVPGGHGGGPCDAKASPAGERAPGGPTTRVDPVGRVLLGLAAVAVAFAAADTYVVVLALPEMMAASGLSAEQLQEGAPIISGFLLGYVGALPLVGRIADLRGRIPVLVGSMLVFAVGSMVTGVGLRSRLHGHRAGAPGRSAAGGLVPTTLALVADLYPPRRRNIPLGIVNGVQEFGNVVGPLYGALVLAFGTWRDIFWINLAVGLVLAAVIRRRGVTERALRGAARASDRPIDWISIGLSVGALVCGAPGDASASAAGRGRHPRHGLPARRRRHPLALAHGPGRRGVLAVLVLVRGASPRRLPCST